jgi:hypothetical protein
MTARPNVEIRRQKTRLIPHRAPPLLDKRGRVVKWCAVATDIEHRKRTEQLQAELA